MKNGKQTKICSYNDLGCKYRGQEQPIENFISRGRELKTCEDCRRRKARLRENWGSEYSPVERSSFIDPWYEVCQECPLEDCVREEGAYTVAPTKGKTYPTCLVWVADNRGLTPEEALDKIRITEVLKGDRG